MLSFQSEAALGHTSRDKLQHNHQLQPEEQPSEIELESSFEDGWVGEDVVETLEELVWDARECWFFWPLHVIYFVKKKKKKLNTLFDGFKWITFDEIAFFFLKMLARSSLKGDISIMVAPEVIAVEINECKSHLFSGTGTLMCWLDTISSCSPQTAFSFSVSEGNKKSSELSEEESDDKYILSSQSFLAGGPNGTSNSSSIAAKANGWPKWTTRPSSSK